MPEQAPTALYGAAARAYLAAGWPSVLPLPPAAKTPPPGGYTGRQGAWPTNEQIEQWTATHADGNLALRLPPDVIGIDVDAYGDKPGADTLTTLETELGPLPPTLVTSSRDDSTSGIRLYRTQPRPTWHDPGPGIEIIHYGWRYVIAAPSIHDTTGRPYRWIDQATGEIITGAPTLDRLPDLPDTWANRLATDDPNTKTAPQPDQIDRWLDQLDDGRPCTTTRNTLDAFHRDLRTAGSRHDSMLDATGRIVRAIDRGHHGGQAALDEAHAAFLAAVTADGTRTIPIAESEWRRALQGAWQLVAATPTPDHEKGCRCADSALPGVTTIATPDYTTPNPTPDDSTPDAPAASWRIVDLDPILDGTWEPPQPTALARDDGTCLLYPAATNAIFGESESGKSWIALHAAAQQLNTGRHVLYLDFEASAAVIVHRLLTLQVPADMIRTGFTYIAPDGPLDDNATALLRTIISLHAPTLAVLDGITGAMGLHGWDPLSNVDVEKFDRLLPRPLAATGAAVLTVDHVTKSRDAPTKYAIGGQHKRAAISGAAYRIDVVQTLAPGRVGLLRLTIAKDRHGTIRAAHPTTAGMFRLDSTRPDAIVARIEAPDNPDKPFRPTHIMQRVSELLEDTSQPLIANEICREIGSKKATVMTAIKTLIDDGFVEVQRTANGHLHRSIRPYRDEELA